MDGKRLRQCYQIPSHDTATVVVIDHFMMPTVKFQKWRLNNQSVLKPHVQAVCPSTAILYIENSGCSDPEYRIELYKSRMYVL